jgi:hypothetical protein
MSETPKQLFFDKEMICRDCGAPFVWTAGEQSYFQLRQLAEPKRCHHCRKTKRESVQRKAAEVKTA